MSEKVAILLSTYNGQEYLAQQIESIQNQTYKDWKLYIRDDGSTDNTVKIIKEYCKSDSRIFLINSSFRDNLGPLKSFFYLLKKVQASVYFFCDQDDLWLQNKLEVMLNEYSKTNYPQLLYSDLSVVNENLQKIPDNNFEFLIGKITNQNRFVDNDIPGCVMMIDRQLRDLAVNYTKNYTYISMHDWWLALIAESFGRITFINKKLVLYRQHGNNALGAGLKSQNNIFQKLFSKKVINLRKKHIKKIYFQNNHLLEEYGDLLNHKYKKFLIEFKKCKYSSYYGRYKFLNKYSLKRTSYFQTIAFKMLFIFDLKNILNEDMK